MQRSCFLASVLFLIPGVLAAQSVHRMTLADCPLAVDVDLPGFFVVSNSRLDGGAECLLDASASDAGFAVTISFRRADTSLGASSTEIRDRLLPRVHAAVRSPSDVAALERFGFATIEYRLHGTGTPTLIEHVVDGFLLRDGTLLYVHCSMEKFSPAGAEQIHQVLARVRYTEFTESPEARAARAASLRKTLETARLRGIVGKKWDEAAALYRRVFESERFEPLLPLDQWVSMIDELAMVYTNLGEAVQARYVLEQAIERDSTRPLFHWDLAHVEAAVGNGDSALAHLRRAYELCSSRGGTEKLPDVYRDPAFAKLLRDPRFARAVVEIIGR